MEWIKAKTKLPGEKIVVMARNPHVESLSWIDGKDELGKPSWCHETWEHADGYVVEWRYLHLEEYYKLINCYRGSKFEKYNCRIHPLYTLENM